jgi:hypothetical protein
VDDRDGVRMYYDINALSSTMRLSRCRKYCPAPSTCLSAPDAQLAFVPLMAYDLKKKL